ncbi:H-NS family nucleoid-associated regulatory protein [Candidatus Magnetaquicoccus inordinatus]|uniref:H-NS histone family protein n=1 Tax=Candidatus Magnetaquicoccus inordinatus TaxID=2496818 RepID=UPI00102B7403|nr:H-NS histone family protein [Candidatus Magnetaquicoccus inordinatus]
MAKETKAEEKDVVSAISDMSLEDLMAFNVEVESLINRRQHNLRKELYEQMMTLVSNAGFTSLDEVLAVQKARRVRSDKGIKTFPRYRNPADNTQTWSGRGRRPQWVVNYLSQGGDLQALVMEE